MIFLFISGMINKDSDFRDQRHPNNVCQKDDSNYSEKSATNQPADQALLEKQAELAYLLSLRDSSALLLQGYQRMHEELFKLKEDSTGTTAHKISSCHAFGQIFTGQGWAAGSLFFLENFKIFKVWADIMNAAGQISSISGEASEAVFVKLPRK